MVLPPKKAKRAKTHKELPHPKRWRCQNHTPPVLASHRAKLSTTHIIKDWLNREHRLPPSQIKTRLFKAKEMSLARPITRRKPTHNSIASSVESQKIIWAIKSINSNLRETMKEQIKRLILCHLSQDPCSLWKMLLKPLRERVLLQMALLLISE